MDTSQLPAQLVQFLAPYLLKGLDRVGRDVIHYVSMTCKKTCGISLLALPVKSPYPTCLIG